MNNKKIPTGVGTVIIIIIAVTVGLFVWKCEKFEEENAVQIQKAVAPTKSNEVISEQQNRTEQETIEAAINWKTYRDKQHAFEFKYPEKYSIETRVTSSTGEYFIKDVSDNVVHAKLTKWKGHVIKEGTPGTFWEKLAYANWKYFADSFDLIQSGNCDDEAIAHVPGPVSNEKTEICIVDKQSNYIKVETERSIIYYTKNLEMSWDSSPQNFNLIKEITQTFKMN
jgi:hypothetical protein